MAQNGATHDCKTARIVKFEELEETIQTLLQKAVKVRENAYAPYSKFHVGACVELETGEMVTGCNVENASFTVGTCAERCALVKAISEGNRCFKRIAVVAYQEHAFTSPCGACRQFMNEFGNFEVYLSKPDLQSVLTTTVGELLPFGFGPNKDYSIS